MIWYLIIGIGVFGVCLNLVGFVLQKMRKPEPESIIIDDDDDEDDD